MGRRAVVVAAVGFLAAAAGGRAESAEPAQVDAEDSGDREVVVVRPDGSLVVRPEPGGAGPGRCRFRFDSLRWGRYAVFLHARAPFDGFAGEAALVLDGEEIGSRRPVAVHEGAAYRLGSLYLAREGAHLLDIAFGEGPAGRRAAAAVGRLLLRPAPEGDPIVQDREAGGPIELRARDATAWGRKLRYEPKPEKDCLGFWTDAGDFPEWRFEVARPGTYRVVVHQGCGSGHGGSEVEVVVEGAGGDGAPQRLPFTVVETGHFQAFEPVVAGEVRLGEPGAQVLAVRVRNLRGGAVMDIRRIVLEPVSGGGGDEKPGAP